MCARIFIAQKNVMSLWRGLGPSLDPIHMEKTENRNRLNMHIIFSKIPSQNLKLHMRMRNDLFYVP